jgi:hypothetical protein
LSISERTRDGNDFEQWLAREFAEIGAFTVIVILVQIGETLVTPLRSTYFNVIGDDVDWSDIVVMFAGAGAEWDGVAFFPVVASDGGPLDNPTARDRLRDKVHENLLVFNEGQFFDKWGRHMKIEEMAQR